MLLHYKINNQKYKFLIKHLYEPSKTYIFLITRHEDISQKILEEVLTIYLIKSDLISLKNLVIVIYKNKYYLSKFVEITKFKLLILDYKNKVRIKCENVIDDKLILLYKTKIDPYYSSNLYFDKFDYNLLTYANKKELRLKRYRKYTRREKLKRLFSFKFLRKEKIA